MNNSRVINLPNFTKYLNNCVQWHYNYELLDRKITDNIQKEKTLVTTYSQQYDEFVNDLCMPVRFEKSKAINSADKMIKPISEIYYQQVLKLALTDIIDSRRIYRDNGIVYITDILPVLERMIAVSHIKNQYMYGVHDFSFFVSPMIFMKLVNSDLFYDRGNSCGTIKKLNLKVFSIVNMIPNLHNFVSEKVLQSEHPNLIREFGILIPNDTIISNISKDEEEFPVEYVISKDNILSINIYERLDLQIKRNGVSALCTI